MQGSLALHDGVLYVGRHAKTAHVAWYDLGGRLLCRGFSFRDPRLTHATASGIAVDADRRIWVADTPADRVRCFNVFGTEIGGFGGPPADGAEPRATDVEGRIAAPVGVSVEGGSEELRLTVALGGVRRHAVLVFDETGACVRSLRPKGDAHGTFDRVRSVSTSGRFTYVCEGGRTCIQVFRDGDFHFAFRTVPSRTLEAGPEPRAARALPDGRIVVACGSADGSEHGVGGLFLFDRAGRLVKMLAEPGAADGAVFEPSDVAVLAGEDERSTLIAVIDQDGERVQVFTLEGRCYGAFEELAG